MRPSSVRLAVPALLVLGATLAACTRQPTAGLPPGTTVEDLPESESWDARLRTSEDGRRQLELDAPYLARYTRDSNYVYLGPAPGAGSSPPVVVRVFDEEGRPSASVQASEAWIYESDGRLVAQGDVQTTVEGENGADLRADRMTLVDGTVEAEGSARATVRSASAQIEASRLTISEGGGFAASGGTIVHMTGQMQAVVTARRVSGSPGGDRLEAEGDARVQASGGRTLQAGRVIWDEGAGRFRAPGVFSFSSPGERVRGVGLTANRDLTRYSFRNITGEIEVQE